MNLRRQAIKYFSETKSSEPELYASAAKTLQRGESFLLPEGGYFFDANKDLDIPLDGMRLPFDRCILEWTDGPASLMLVMQERGDGDDFILLPVWSTDGMEWTPAPIAIVIVGNEVISAKDGVFQVTAQISQCPTRTSPPAEFLNAEAYRHELIVAAQFLLLANCGNVSPVKIHEPPDKQRKAAAKRGNAPFHSYWTLDCALPSSPAEVRSLGGTHAAPRLHMRRGHVRRLPTGKTTWVRQCAVGNANLGTVSKDYTVHA